MYWFAECAVLQFLLFASVFWFVRCASHVGGVTPQVTGFDGIAFE